MSTRIQSNPPRARISVAMGLHSWAHAPEVFLPALILRFTGFSNSWLIGVSFSSSPRTVWFCGLPSPPR